MEERFYIIFQSLHSLIIQHCKWGAPETAERCPGIHSKMSKIQICNQTPFKQYLCGHALLSRVLSSLLRVPAESLQLVFERWPSVCVSLCSSSSAAHRLWQPPDLVQQRLGWFKHCDLQPLLCLFLRCFLDRVVGACPIRVKNPKSGREGCLKADSLFLQNPLCFYVLLPFFNTLGA